MTKKMIPRLIAATMSLALGLGWLAVAAPKPNPPVEKSELLKLTGKFEGAKLSEDVRILWLAGPEDHGGGEHDYIRIKELFVPMLRSIPRVTVDEAFNFPTQAQFDAADVMIQYLHLPDLSDEQFGMLHGFVQRGGGVVSIHESCIMRPTERAEKLARLHRLFVEGKPGVQVEQVRPRAPTLPRYRTPGLRRPSKIDPPQR